MTKILSFATKIVVIYFQISSSVNLKVYFKFFFNIFAKVPSGIWKSQNQSATWKMCKLLKNMKMKWISMLSLIKKVMVIYKTLLAKISMDMGLDFQVATNFDLLVNLEILLSPYYMLELMHNWLNFHKQKKFLCVILLM
jgi:hypothetical protein